MQGYKGLKEHGISVWLGRRRNLSADGSDGQGPCRLCLRNFFPAGNGELLLKSGNDVGFAFLKYHFSYKMKDIPREWRAVSSRI